MNKMLAFRLLAFEAVAVVFWCTTLPGWCQQLSVSPHGNLFKDLDSRAILSCSFINFDQAQSSDLDLRWIGPDNQPIKHKHGRVHVEQYDRNTVKLYISGLKETDAGAYSCQLENNGQLFTETVQLSLHEDIRFEENPTSYEVKVGEHSVLLVCSAVGLPLPAISWRFNKVKVPDVSEKYIYEKNGLRIKEVALGDNGTYECRAQIESQGSLKIRNINLNILYPPIITEQPTIVDHRVIKGQDAVLHCAADGNPPVRYDWLLEKRMSDLVKAKVPVQRGAQTLRIRNIDSDNEGRYFCRVSNSVGMQEAYVDLTMLVPPVIKDLAERVTVEGRTLIVPCELINGRPSPELFWYSPAGQKFTEETQTDDASITVDNTHRGVSKLIIRNIRRSQSGDYFCEAVNSVGNDSKVAVINVDYVPRISSSANEVFAWTGQVRNLTCVTDGQPLPVVSWFSRGQHVFDSITHKLETTKTKNVTTSTLQITIGDKQPWVFGSYTCIAKNSHGSTSVTFQLREAELPDLPHNVSVLEIRDTETTMVVTPPMKTGGIPLTSWMVRYEPVPQRDAKEKTIFFDPEPGEPLETLKVTDLLPDTEYKFYLSAGNDVGFGEPIKFLVRTHRKSLLKEQSDVPQKSDAGSQENVWKDPAALGKMSSDGSDSDGQNSSVGVILAVISALAILVLLSVGIAFGVRRLRSEGRLKNLVRFPWAKDDERVDSTKGDEAEKGLQAVEVKHPSEALPGAGDETADGTGDDFVKGVTSIPHGTGLSPKPGRVCSPLTSVRSLTLTPSSIHKFSWEHHALETREFNDEDLSSGFGTADQPELSLMSDVPPLVQDEVEGRADQPNRVTDPDEDSILDVNLDEEDSK